MRAALCALTGARHVQILCGSGTLANDAVAAQISRLSERGLILSNGEFGDRLLDHAARFNLRFDTIRLNWGDVFDVDRVAQRLAEGDRPAWLWAVHCETSSGVLNPLPALARLCRQRGVRLCVDCVSSLGVVPVDLRNIYLASSSSGKGLASYAGLSMVFHNAPLEGAARLPRYLDLRYYERARGVPFTLPSNLLYALHSALAELQRPHERFARIAALSGVLHAGLRAVDLCPLWSGAPASPAVSTIPLPPTLRADRVARACLAEGCAIAWRSDYLRARNAIQICLMGQLGPAEVGRLLSALKGLHRLHPQRALGAGRGTINSSPAAAEAVDLGKLGVYQLKGRHRR